MGQCSKGDAPLNVQDEIARRNRDDLAFYQGVADTLRAHFCADPVPNALDKELLTLIGGRIEALKADIAAEGFYHD